MNRFILPPIEQCCYLDEDHHAFVSLSSEQYQKVQRLCRMIAEDTHTKFIYRGDNRVRSIYNASIDSAEFAKCFFMVGEKGNEFLCDITLTDDIEEYASSLFKQLHNFVNGRYINRAVENRLQQFNKENEMFVNFFKEPNNEDIFKSALSSPLKWTINDYYEMFLHTIRKNGENNITSNMLSTTLDINTTMRFKQEDGVLIVGWVKESGLITFRDMNKRDEKIHRLGLPTYKRGLFPEQQEICLKYGLPPHNILGYFYGDACQYFVINHNLLCNQKNDIHFDKIHKRGIYINQTNFLEYLGLTKYKRGYRLVANEYTYLH